MGRLNPGCRALLLAVAFFLPLTAVAQDAPPEILIGPLKFRPSIQASVDQRNNLFQQTLEDEETDARVDAVGAVLSLELPTRRSRFVLNYTPEYRRYENDVIPSDWVHVADFLMELITRRDLELVIKDSFEKGILEVQDVTGGEGTFQGDKFTRNQFSLRTRIPVRARHGIQIGAYSDYITFDTDELRATFFDVDGQGLSGGYFYDLSETLRLAGEARLDQVEQEREPFLIFDPGSGEFVPLEGSDRRDYDFSQYTVSVEGNISSRIHLNLRPGYGQQDFTSAPGSDFSGLLLNGTIRMDVTSRFYTELNVNRRPTASFFNVSNFFINESIEARLVKRTFRRLRLSLSVTYQTNDYPDPVVLDLNGDGIDDIPANPALGIVAGLERRDRLLRGAGRIDFAILPGRLGLFLRASYSERSSNIAIFEFETSSLAFGLKFGWLGPQDHGI